MEDKLIAETTAAELAKFPPEKQDEFIDKITSGEIFGLMADISKLKDEANPPAAPEAEEDSTETEADADIAAMDVTPDTKGDAKADKDLAKAFNADMAEISDDDTDSDEDDEADDDSEEIAKPQKPQGEKEKAKIAFAPADELDETERKARSWLLEEEKSFYERIIKETLIYSC